jgi:hypothetical protein
MTSKIIFASVFILSVSCLTSSCKSSTEKETISEVVESDKPNTLSASEVKAGWELLFNGRSTDKWRGYNRSSFPTKGWFVDGEGNLCVSKSGTEEEGFGGDIMTKARYENFELKVDFMVSDTGNSGILYRVLEASDMAIWQNAQEYQVLDDQTYIDMGGMDMNTHLTGDNYDLQSSSGRYSNPVGQWNRAKIIVDGQKVEHWLNGEKTIECVLGSEQWDTLVSKSKFKEYPDFGRAIEGHIGLQDHGHLIKFRNLKIKPLPSHKKVLFNGKDLTGWEPYGTEKWYVENGLLVCESGPDKQYGYLATIDSFKNFDLTLEFLQEADGNSGVFFRSSIEGTKIAGWQAEVAPPGLHTGGIYESYGRGWLIQPEESSDSSLKMGDWNKMRIYVNRNHVITWLNGEQMINFHDDTIGDANGQIALQIHDGGGIKVKWRNIEIRKL